MNLEVDVYRVTEVKSRKFSDLAEAKKYADQQFEETDVYKVKVWDIAKGPRIRNVVNPANLVYHLV